MPEKRDQSWYRSPDGELRFVYCWEEDGLTVQVAPQTWVPVSTFAGWVLVPEDNWGACRQWAKENGWRWIDG